MALRLELLLEFEFLLHGLQFFDPRFSGLLGGSGLDSGLARFERSFNLLILIALTHAEGFFLGAKLFSPFPNPGLPQGEFVGAAGAFDSDGLVGRGSGRSKVRERVTPNRLSSKG